MVIDKDIVLIFLLLDFNGYYGGDYLELFFVYKCSLGNLWKIDYFVYVLIFKLIF